MSHDIGILERRLGYHFDNRDLLEVALTHRSHGASNYERLEFLGDALLGAVIAEALYRRFPKNVGEGKLTRMRARLVKGETLAVIAEELEVAEFLRLGGGEMRSGGTQRRSIRADVVEAVLGAVYLDSDFESVQALILRLFEARLDSVSPSIEKDPKTRLQERLQKLGRPLPEYVILSQSGKPHDLTFEIQCSADEPEQSVIACGKSRRTAEQKAAALMLAQLE